MKKKLLDALKKFNVKNVSGFIEKEFVDRVVCIVHLCER